MKQKILVICIALILVLVCSLIAFPKASEFFTLRSDILEKQAIIDSNESIIRSLEAEFRAIRGISAPRTLKEAMGMILQFEDVEIVQIQSFNLDGSGIVPIESVTSMSYAKLCDGFVIELSVSDFAGFMQHLDEIGLTYHSVDFLFGASTAILRIRTGGASYG